MKKTLLLLGVLTLLFSGCQKQLNIMNNSYVLTEKEKEMIEFSIKEKYIQEQEQRNLERQRNDKQNEINNYTQQYSWYTYKDGLTEREIINTGLRLKNKRCNEYFLLKNKTVFELNLYQSSKKETLLINHTEFFIKYLELKKLEELKEILINIKKECSNIITNKIIKGEEEVIEKQIKEIIKG